MEENKFKQQYKSAACSRAPWASVIERGKRDSIMRQIRIECVQAYGYDLDTCPSRLTCIGKSCLGREMPYKSPTALPYLKKMEKLGLIKDQQYYVKDCNDCPIRKSCTSVCPMMNDFLNRHQKKQPDLVYQESVDNYSPEPLEQPTLPSELSGLTLPWDCLKDAWKLIVKLRLEERKDFLTISSTCNLFDQAAAKKEFYYALTKLAEYAIVREFIKEKKEYLTLGQYEILKAKYIDNKSREQIAKEHNITYNAVRHKISKTLKKHKVEWPIYVKKEKGKLIYNIPKVLQ